MKIDIEDMIVAALKLPVQARALLAEKLIESLDSDEAPELSSAWHEEIAKRCREIDEGRVKLRDEQDVFDRAYSMLE